MNMTLYDEEIVDIEEQDDLGSVSGNAPKFVQHFVGSDENPYEDGDSYAKGYHLPLKQFQGDERFAAVMQAMIDDGSATHVRILHKGNPVDYLKLKSWAMYPLTPNVPYWSAVEKDIREAKGMACGVTIQWDEKERPAEGKRLTYVAVLGVVKSLYEYGYVDDFGTPIPLAFKFTGYNGGDLTKALQIHHKYTSTMRQERREGLNGYKKRGQEPLYSYLLELVVSKEKMVRGTGAKVKRCYTMVNANSEPKNWTPELEQALYCGDELFVKLRDMLYVVSGNARISGGPAYDYCMNTIAYHKERSLRLDPGNTLKDTLGTFTVPATWLIDNTLRAQSQLREAVRGDRETIAPLTPAEKVQAKINAYAALFKNDPEGTALVQKARSATGETLVEIMDDLSARRAFLAEETPF
jgi:hypothetical protein